MGIENTCVKMFCVILAQIIEFKSVFDTVSWLVQGIVCPIGKHQSLKSLNLFMQQFQMIHIDGILILTI